VLPFGLSHNPNKIIASGRSSRLKFLPYRDVFSL
jgi:hypothetical protein